MKNIEEFEDTEIVQYLNDLTIQYGIAPDNVRSDVIYPSDDLVDALTLIEYLIVSGINTSADSTYSELKKAFEIELSRRLGDLPK